MLEIIGAPYQEQGLQMISAEGEVFHGVEEGTPEHTFRQYKRERHRRHPLHTRGRVTMSHIEPDPKVPILAPRPDREPQRVYPRTT